MTHTFDNEYWDQIWHGDRAQAMATSQPNPHLVREVGDLTPGTALDAGCGAGAEAIWLATRGWQVTAADIASEALARAAERADAGGVAERVQWVQADLSTWEPDAQYDLVTTHYAHPAMPQLEFYDRIATWVAPGGTLLIVGHLHHARITAHGHGHDDGPPAEASATAATITARLDPAEWTVVTAEESHRTMPGRGEKVTPRRRRPRHPPLSRRLRAGSARRGDALASGDRCRQPNLSRSGTSGIAAPSRRTATRPGARARGSRRGRAGTPRGRSYPAHTEPFGGRGEPQVLDRAHHRVETGIRDRMPTEHVRTTAGRVVADHDAQPRLDDALDLDPVEGLRSLTVQ